jgi:septum formation protein
MPHRLILASKSAARKMLLANAGLQFEALSADIDERTIEAGLEVSKADPIEVARVLAVEKAKALSLLYPQALVIGCDQTMSLGSRVYHKPATMDEAFSHIKSLSAATHQLNSAVALVKNGELLWDYVSSAHMHVRELSDAFIEHHLQRVGERALTSVGAYQLEGEGIQLFEKIDGDYFTILGLPLLPLLSKLRALGDIND